MRTSGLRSPNRAVFRLFVLGVALLVLPRFAPAQSDECLVEFQDEVGSLPDDWTLCQTASDRVCTFSLRLCLNSRQDACTPSAFQKKKFRTMGHCGAVGRLQVSPVGDSSVCGTSFTEIKVHTRNNGNNQGKCKLRVGVRSARTHARTDLDHLNLVCNPKAVDCPTIPARQAPVPLGAATNFAVLAGSTLTNTGATTITGDIGVSPGTAVTGFPPGTVNGAMHAGDSAAAQAQIDLTTAFNDAAGRSVGTVTVSGNLGGRTLTPGLYKSTSSLAISSGDLTLDGQGDSNAVFIFQMASTLTTTAGRQVILSGGAKASNVFWQVGSAATLGTTSVFKGTILADQSITLNTGAALDGRALARIAAVALDANTITTPIP
jgi:hypothetical protein